MKTVYLVVPGVTNSSPQHWQSLWEKQFPERFRRIEQAEWDTPVCDDWTKTIETEVRKESPERVVLVAHSLGCTAVAHWAKRFGTRIKGAVLVAPSDCEAETYNFDTKGFAPIPLEKLPFPSLVIASENDEYISLTRARQFAGAWGSEIINVGAKGHINAAAGFGEWSEGLELLKRLD
ncbi:MAG TPA: alpha/beta hydrolase [Pyrinomonadaceae bacterium]|jgi:predicted alpha/beta hydrolase family esterase|nr:alpha/beta hydrolase [Pyrinomonadaceae bacterium]